MVGGKNALKNSTRDLPCQSGVYFYPLTFHLRCPLLCGKHYRLLSGQLVWEIWCLTTGLIGSQEISVVYFVFSPAIYQFLSLDKALRGVQKYALKWIFCNKGIYNNCQFHIFVNNWLLPMMSINSLSLFGESFHYTSLLLLLLLLLFVLLSMLLIIRSVDL